MFLYNYTFIKCQDLPFISANGSQQLISIPVSLAAGGGSQIQLLSTPSGGIIATNLATKPAVPQNLTINTSQTTTDASKAVGYKNQNIYLTF